MRLKDAFSWGKVLSTFFSIQLLIQGISATVGIIIVRHVDKHDYAYYTITNTFMSSATALTDCGISAALSALGGKIWTDDKAFGSLLNTALSIRKWLAATVVVVVVLIVPAMLAKNGANLLLAGVLTTILIVSMLFQFGSGVLGIVPQLKADYSLLQRVALVTGCTRLLLLVLFYFTVLNSVSALLMNCAAYGLQWWFYKRYAQTAVDLTAAPDRSLRKSIFTIVRKQVPYEIYGVLSSQISVFLLSVFGVSSKVADVGALGRIAVIFTAMSSVLANVLVPRFARSQDGRQLIAMFWKIMLLYSVSISSLLVVAWLFPAQVVSILGRQYKDLGSECLLAIGCSVTGAIVAAIWGLNASRGWIIPAWLGLSVGLAAQTAGIVFFNIRSVHGVLMMNLATNCVGLLLNFSASAWFLKNARGLSHGQGCVSTQ
jgi:O-antigen/teichoic acid export membrane protein